MATASSINEPVLCREESGLTEQKTFEFASIADAVRDLKAGRMIVVVDDEDRENEGDLMIAAEMITPKAINLMATQGRGLICLAMTGERLDQLELAPMVSCNSALGGTAFTVSIDARCDGVTTGISAHDRVLTTRTAIDPNSYPEDLARPGHVFPLRARPGGVLERQGHTEANPLTASRMTRRQVAATVYAPLRVLLSEDGDSGGILAYDKPSSLIVEFGDERVTVVGRCGDETVEAALLRAGRP